VAFPGVGDPAPDFTLPATGGCDVTLSALREQPVVVVFYPGDNTPVCTSQLNAYTRDIGQFEGLGARVLAISPQDVGSHERFSAEQGGIAFPLLADVDKVVGRSYGVIGPVGFYRRSVFVIDGGGTVGYAHRALAGLSYRPVDELVAAIKAINSS